MATTSDWDDEIYGLLPGATPDQIAQQVEAVLRDFCRRSGAWIVEGTDSTVADQADYDFSSISSPVNGEAVMLMNITLDGKYVPLADTHPISGLTGFSGYAYSQDPGTVTLVPTPTTNGTDNLVAAVAYMPPAGETTIADVFVNQWYEVIRNGILARMMSMPAKPWTNVQLATFHAGAFTRGIGQARDTARRRFSMAEASWSFPRWA